MSRSLRRPLPTAKFTECAAALVALVGLLPIASGLTVRAHAAVPAVTRPSVASTGPALFQDAPEAIRAAASMDAGTGPGVVRARAVTLRANILGSLRPGASRVDLNLFDDARFTGVVDRVEAHRIGGVSFIGRLAEDTDGYFALVTRGEAVAGLVRTGSGGLYEIGTVSPGTHVIRQVVPDALPLCGNGVAQVIPAERIPRADPPRAEESSAGGPSAEGGDRVGPVIDVLVVYTGEAKAAAGGKDAIEAKAQLAIDQGNMAYANSQIGATLHLVHVDEVSYPESTGTSGFSAALSALTNNGDALMDEVHSLRNQYGADVVSLLVKNSAYCGLGWVMTALSTGFASYGFNVVAQNCTSGTTMAHEIGHNQGSHHDRQNAKDTSGNLARGLYTYSYGWRFYGDDGKQYRTVMSYAPGTQIPYFSNPDILYKGQPTGVPIGQPNESNNAQSIQNARYVVAAWRASMSPPEPVLVGYHLAAEEFEPANGAPDPGEVVALAVSLRNASSRTATDLIATLEPGGGIEPIAAQQSYGALASGGDPVERTFQFRAHGLCGGIDTVTLRFHDNGQDLGTVTVPLRLGGLRDPITTPLSSGALTVMIPDTTIVEHSLTVPDLGVLDRAVVRVRIDHTWIADLNLSLVAPDGTTVDLSSGNGSNGNSYGTGRPEDGTVVYTVFDDAAPTSVVAGSAPLAGSYRPESPLAVLSGLDVKGTWTLRVEDRQSGDTGTLLAWGLDLTSRLPSCVRSPVLTMDDVAVALQVASGLAEVRDDQVPRLDVVPDEAPGAVNLQDVVGIARKVAGLD